MEQEKNNLNREYAFSTNKDFILIEKNLGHHFDAEDMANIDKLLSADKDIIIENFHNLFSLNKDSALREITLSLKRGLLDEKTKEIYEIFHTLLKKYDWTICMNLESFIEEYKDDSR